LSFSVFVSCCFWHHCQRMSFRFGRIDISNLMRWREVPQTGSSIGGHEQGKVSSFAGAVDENHGQA
jgi:hypothetical protein